MGTDIHGVVQHRYWPDAPWQAEPGFEDTRNYRVFAALADVRNGYGFAGVTTHVPIRIIAEPRGIPADFSCDSLWWVGDGESRKYWLGDHSFSWLTVSEVASWDGWDQQLSECGYITRAQYESFSGEAPEDWCGGISGPGVIHASAVENTFPDGWTHVLVTWSRPLSGAVAVFLAWVRYLDEKHRGHDARLVFGFDS